MAESPFFPGPEPAPSATTATPPTLRYHLVARCFVTSVRNLLPRLIAAETMSDQTQIRIVLLLCALDEQFEATHRATAGQIKRLCESLSQHILPSLGVLAPSEQLEYRAAVQWYLSESPP